MSNRLSTDEEKGKHVAPPNRSTAESRETSEHALTGENKQNSPAGPAQPKRKRSPADEQDRATEKSGELDPDNLKFDGLTVTSDPKRRGYGLKRRGAIDPTGFERMYFPNGPSGKDSTEQSKNSTAVPFEGGNSTREAGEEDSTMGPLDHSVACSASSARTTE